MTIKQFEQIEKDILIKLFKNEKYLTSRFDRNDLFIDLSDKVIIGEFKFRQCKSTDYPDFFLEVKKSIALLQKAKQHKHFSIIYINLFFDKVVIWDLKKIFKNKLYTTDNRLMNTTTAQGFKRAGEKEYKDVFLLNKKDAFYEKETTL